MPMPDGIKTQWVADLRDPKRVQAMGHLRNVHGGQCCLDVLCEQAVKAGVIGEPELDSALGVYVYTWGADDWEFPHEESETLPNPVYEWAGLENNNPYVTFKNPLFEEAPDNPSVDVDHLGQKRVDFECMAELNDTWNLNFAEIADIIEASDL